MDNVVALLGTCAPQENPFGTGICGYIQVIDPKETDIEKLDQSPMILFVPSRDGWREAWRETRKEHPGIVVQDWATPWAEGLSEERVDRWYEKLAALFERIRVRRELRA